MKKIHTLFALIIFNVSVGCYADVGQPNILNLYFYAHSEVEVTDLNGRYIRLDYPLTQYKALDLWDMAEPSKSPSMIDVVVLLSHEFSKEIKIKISVNFFENVGPLLLDKRLGVTDIEKGRRKAKWSDRSIAVKSIVYTSLPETQQLALTIRDIPIKKLAMGRKKIGDAIIFFRETKDKNNCVPFKNLFGWDIRSKNQRGQVLR